MPVPSLPQEILDDLVDCASPNFEDLKQLALTSPCFVERSQSYLFRKLTFNMGIPEAKRSILEHKPQLLKHCRELSITFDLTIPLAHALGRADRQTILARIVEELQGLTNVSIEPHSRINWVDVSPLCQSIVVKLLNHPLRYLSIAAFRSFPHNLIYPRLANTVESFRLQGTSFSIESPIPGGGAPLKTKTVICYGRAVGSLLRLVGSCGASALANVTALSLNIGGESNEDSHPEAMALVAHASSSLRVLKLNYPFFLSEVEVNLGDSGCSPLPTIPTLQYLSIHSSTTFFVDNSAYSIHPTVPRFLHAVLSINPQPALEVIEVKVSWVAFPLSPDDMDLDREDAPSILHGWDSWSALDELLSSPSRYPRLRGAQFTPGPVVSERPSIIGTSTSMPMTNNEFKSLISVKFQSEIMAAMGATRMRVDAFVALCESAEFSGVEETGPERMFGEM